MRRASKTRLAIVGQEFSEDVSKVRPRTRADCASVPRPCQFVGCRHNLYLDVSDKTGAIKTNFPDLEPDQVAPDASCALDVVDAHPGGLELEAVGALLNVSRERIRQLEVAYEPRLREGLEHLRLELTA